MTATPIPAGAVDAARAEYADVWRAAAQSDCWCRSLDAVQQCGSWLWLDVEAASLKSGNAVAEWWAGCRPSIGNRQAGVAW